MPRLAKRSRTNFSCLDRVRMAYQCASAPVGTASPSHLQTCLPSPLKISAAKAMSQRCAHRGQSDDHAARRQQVLDPMLGNGGDLDVTLANQSFEIEIGQSDGNTQISCQRSLRDSSVPFHLVKELEVSLGLYIHMVTVLPLNTKGQCSRFEHNVPSESREN